MRIWRKFWFLKQGKAYMQNLFPGTRGLMWQVQLRSDAPLIFDDCPFHFACFVYLKPLKQRELSRHSGKEIKLHERLKLSMLFLLLSSSKVFSCNPWGVLIWFLSELHKIHKLLKCIIVYILEHIFYFQAQALPVINDHSDGHPCECCFLIDGFITGERGNTEVFELALLSHRCAPTCNVCQTGSEIFFFFYKPHTYSL